MALLPYLVNPLLEDYDPFYGNLNRFTAPSLLGLSTPMDSGYLRMLRHLQPEDSGISSVQDSKDEMKISLDVQEFKPEEIKVKITDNFVIIEGNHEERKDEHGFVSRKFVRKYRLPPNVKTEAVSSNLSSDGLLQIVAPKKPDTSAQKAREIKVVQTKKPAIKDAKSPGGDNKMETS